MRKIYVQWNSHSYNLQYNKHKKNPITLRYKINSLHAKWRGKFPPHISQLIIQMLCISLGHARLLYPDIFPAIHFNGEWEEG